MLASGFKALSWNGLQGLGWGVEGEEGETGHLRPSPALPSCGISQRRLGGSSSAA